MRQTATNGVPYDGHQDERQQAGNGAASRQPAPALPLNGAVSEYARELDEMLVAIGRRVRAGRTRERLSRRMLSERSGVSERFLAQLEHGQGNISIVRLRAIATALRLELSDLVRGEPRTGSPQLEDETSAVAALYRRADPVTQRRALAVLLSPEAEPRP